MFIPFPFLPSLLGSCFCKSAANNSLETSSQPLLESICNCFTKCHIATKDSLQLLHNHDGARANLQFHQKQRIEKIINKLCPNRGRSPAPMQLSRNSNPPATIPSRPFHSSHQLFMTRNFLQTSCITCAVSEAVQTRSKTYVEEEGDPQTEGRKGKKTRKGRREKRKEEKRMWRSSFL